MKINNESGLLDSATITLSPNFDERPDKEDLSGIVIHNISLPPGKFGDKFIDDLFLNKLDCSAHPYFNQLDGLKVSSHLLIRRTGDIVQFVPFHARAWHAGVSQWQGRERCNDFTVGIELEGCDDTPFEQEQYEVLAKVILTLCKTYPNLSKDKIIGHEHIAPGRKTDPGPYFDWLKLTNMLER